MANSSDISITGLGMITSVGHDVKTSCASIRAGIVRAVKLDNFYVPSPDYEDDEDGLVTGYPVFKDGYDNGKDRIFSMFACLLKDLCEYSKIDADFVKETPLYISLPSKERAIINKDEMTKFVYDNSDETMWSPQDIHIYEIGHAGMIYAIKEAIESIKAGRYRQAIIAGVDTLIGFNDLQRFNRDERLKTELNSDGLMPGEGASAVLIEKLSAAENRKARIEAIIHTVSTGYEKDNILSGAKATGQGYAEIIKGLLDSAEDKEISAEAIICDINGEEYRFEELSMLHPKVLNSINGDKDILYPAGCIGDTGAASGGISICVGVRGMVRGYLKRKGADEVGNGLILSSSDSGERGIIYLTPYRIPSP